MVRAITLSGEYMSFIFMQNMVNGARRDADPLMRYRNIIFGAFGKFGASLWVFFQHMNLRGDCFGIAHVKHSICGGEPVKFCAIFKNMRPGQNRQAKGGRFQWVMPTSWHQ